MNRCRTLLGICLGLIEALDVHGQTKKPTPQLQETRKFAQTAIDLESSNLGKGYIGNDCRRIATALKAFKPAKGEFETKADFDQRLEKIQASPLYGALKVDSLIALPREPGMVTSKYLADDKQLVMDYFTRTITTDLGYVHQVDSSESKVVRRETYVGSNAYGKSAKIEKTVHDVCGIAFNNVPSVGASTQRMAIIDVDPDEARDAKENMAILYIGKLRVPMLIEYAAYSKPTFDLPYESIWGGSALVVQLTDIWYYNSVSGKVYLKQKP